MTRNGTFGLIAWMALASVAQAQSSVTEDTKKVAESSNRFALDLYDELRGTEGNLFFSPSSLHQALSLTYLGAKGDTATQMARVLHLTMPPLQAEAGLRGLQRRMRGEQPGEQGKAAVTPGNARGVAGALGQQEAGKATEISEVDRIIARLRAARDGKQPSAETSPGNSLSSVNALWPDKRVGLMPAFVKKASNVYRAAVRPQDFKNDPEGARRAINAAIARQTNNGIPELLGPGTVDSGTALVLTNAIRFQGKWASPFDPNKTKPGTWTNADGSKVESVPFMQQKTEFGYGETDGAKIVDLPYGDGISMTLIVPNEANGLGAVEEQLVAGRLNATLGNLQQKKIDLRMPKFKSESSFQLGGTLAGMPKTAERTGQPSGMVNAFGSMADFSGIAEDTHLQISQVVHKAMVEVDEAGTTAAAATAVVMTRGLSFDPVVNADKPFVYLIRDNQSGAILFVGRMSNPK